MALKIADLLENREAELAECIIDMYNGEQEEHMIEILDTPGLGRKDWKSKGMAPRHRNILKMIIEKSGLLFSDKAPTLTVYQDKSSDTPDEGQTVKLKEQLDQVNWIEFFTNFDSIVRMLKTALVLVNYDQVEGELSLDVLTQHNCFVFGKNNKIDVLVVLGSEGETSTGEEYHDFRVFTQELIEDVRVFEESKEQITLQSVPNLFGIIPVAVFHDTNTPLFDFWNVQPTDLLRLNEMYNLHIIDTEFAASWSKIMTVVTNARIEGVDELSYGGQVSSNGSKFPSTISPQTSKTLSGGPGKVIQIDTMGVDSPFFEYKGAQGVDLQPINEMFDHLVANFAADWCVNVKMAGQGTADSGFKLIVEEMDNQELRRKRARMFEAGFARLYQVIKKVVNIYKPGYYSEESVMFAKFSQPNLPVDIKLQEEVWSRRIAEGRASRLDYFMEVHGMGKEEAQAKIIEIDSIRPAISAPRTMQITKTTGA